MRTAVFVLILTTSAAGQVPEQLRASAASVGKISSREYGGRATLQGSGTYLGGRLVATAAHVMRDTAFSTSGIDFGNGKIPFVKLEDGSHGIQATDEDLAILVMAREPNVPPATMAQRASDPGERIVWFGYGNGSFGTGTCVDTGRKLSSNGKWFTNHLYRGQGPTQGDSGGGVFNMNGEFVGVLHSSAEGETEMVSVPVDHVRNLIGRGGLMQMIFGGHQQCTPQQIANGTCGQPQYMYQGQPQYLQPQQRQQIQYQQQYAPQQGTMQERRDASGQPIISQAARGPTLYEMWRAKPGNQNKSMDDMFAEFQGRDGKNGVDGKDGRDGKDASFSFDQLDSRYASKAQVDQLQQGLTVLSQQVQSGQEQTMNMLAQMNPQTQIQQPQYQECQAQTQQPGPISGGLNALVGLATGGNVPIGIAVLGAAWMLRKRLLPFVGTGSGTT